MRRRVATLLPPAHPPTLSLPAPLRCLTAPLPAATIVEKIGFCFYNNVAVAAAAALATEGIRKVLILDWDVHHGAPASTPGQPRTSPPAHLPYPTSDRHRLKRHHHQRSAALPPRRPPAPPPAGTAGNGIQDVHYRDPNVLFISLHRYGVGEARRGPWAGGRGARFA